MTTTLAASSARCIHSVIASNAATAERPSASSNTARLVGPPSTSPRLEPERNHPAISTTDALKTSGGADESVDEPGNERVPHARFHRFGAGVLPRQARRTRAAKDSAPMT